MSLSLILIILIVILWRKVRQLEQSIYFLEQKLKQSPQVEQTTEQQPQQDLDAEQSLIPPVPLSIEQEQAAYVSEPKADERPQKQFQPPKPQKTKAPDYEKQLAVKLSVWVGAIALVMAGFYLAQYSIQNGILSPLVRMILGFILGGALVYVGHWVHTKPNIDNGKRISQALTGAGIADLYACLFAAGSLYHILPDFICLLGMAILTLATVVISLRQGMPIALLGLVGGFFMPATLSFQFSSPTFFTYLYVIVAAILYVSSRQGWWLLSVLTLFAAFSWVGGWLFFLPVYYLDVHVLSLFLLLVSITAAGIFWQNMKKDDAKNPFALLSIYIAIGLPAVLMCVIQAYSHFTLIEWGIVTLLALASWMLAYFDQKTYGFAPWVSFIVLLVLFFFADLATLNLYTAMILAFALIYAICSYLSQWRAIEPISFAALGPISSIAFYLLTYQKIYLTYGQVSNVLPFFIVAVLAALIYASILYQVWQTRTSEDKNKEALLATYSAAVTAFISLAIAVYCPGKLIPIAFSLQFLALSWIRSRVNLEALTILALLVAAAALVYMLYLVNDFMIYFQHPFTQLAIPSLCFAASSYYLRQKDNDHCSPLIEAIALFGFSCLLYVILRKLFHPDLVLYLSTSMLERATINNSFMLFAFAVLGLGNYIQRRVLVNGALTLFVIVLARILVLDLFFYNPFFSQVPVGAYPIWNLLSISYLTPAILLFIGHKQISTHSKDMATVLDVASLVLVFAWLSFSVRQLFHGSILSSYLPASNAEIISYSIAWMLYGIALIFYGTLKKIKGLRSAGLLIVTLTVGKVFLYDASSLEGLLRVLSFLGLGLCLIGIGWFSSRFIFVRDQSDT